MNRRSGTPFDVVSPAGDVATGVGQAGELADAVVGEERLVADRICDRAEAPVSVVAIASGPELAVPVGGEVEVVVAVRAVPGSFDS